jgi:hypothetical protein
MLAGMIVLFSMGAAPCNQSKDTASIWSVGLLYNWHVLKSANNRKAMQRWRVTRHHLTRNLREIWSHGPRAFLRRIKSENSSYNAVSNGAMPWHNNYARQTWDSILEVWASATPSKGSASKIKILLRKNRFFADKLLLFSQFGEEGSDPSSNIYGEEVSPPSSCLTDGDRTVGVGPRNPEPSARSSTTKCI